MTEKKRYLLAEVYQYPNNPLEWQPRQLFQIQRTIRSTPIQSQIHWHPNKQYHKQTPTGPQQAAKIHIK